jgi:hypothetical protein
MSIASPYAARRRKRFRKRPTPPRISSAPLRSTQKTEKGKYGGMIGT